MKQVQNETRLESREEENGGGEWLLTRSFPREGELVQTLTLPGTIGVGVGTLTG